MSWSRKGIRCSLKKVLAPILLIVASIAFVAANAPYHEQMSPLDEYVYIDYLVKFPDQGVVAQGEMTGDTAREYYSCEGVGIYGKIAPENCRTGDFSSDKSYPFGGRTSADLYTPLYFGVTWIAAQPFLWLTDSDVVGAGRLAGSLWLAAAAVYFFFALGRLQVSLVARFSGALLLIASAAAWWSNTFVSTDGSAMLAGAALLYYGVRYTQTGRGGWLLVSLSGLAVALKFQNFMAVVAIAIYLAITLASQQRTPDKAAAASTRATSSVPRRTTVFTITGMITFSAGVQLAWMAIRSLIAVDEFPDQGVAKPLGLADLMREALKFYGRVGLGFTVPQSQTVGWALAALATWVVMIGVISAIAVEPRFSTRYSLALAALFTLIAAGPALAVVNRITQGFYFDLPVRYGLSMFPLALALSLTLLDRKVETRLAVASLAGVTFIASLTQYFPGNMFA